jgi:excisionase family DNA binding protein
MATLGTSRPEPLALLTFEEVARAFGVSTRTVRRLAEEGTLPIVRVGQRSVRIASDDVERYVAEQRERSAGP